MKFNNGELSFRSHDGNKTVHILVESTGMTLCGESGKDWKIVGFDFMMKNLAKAKELTCPTCSREWDAMNLGGK